MYDQMTFEADTIKEIHSTMVLSVTVVSRLLTVINKGERLTATDIQITERWAANILEQISWLEKDGRHVQR